MLEADFQREYGLDISEALPAMSWRRFIVLLKGLGPNSVYVVTNTKKDEVIEDEKAAEQIFSRW